MTEVEFRAEIVQRARGYLDTPWKFRGRTRQEGVDCGGVTIATGREVGAFAFTWDWTDYKAAIAAKRWGPWPGCTQILRAEAAAGDIYMSESSKGSDTPWHCGVIGETRSGLTLIHAMPYFKGVQELPLVEVHPQDGRRVEVWRMDYPPRGARGDS